MTLPTAEFRRGTTPAPRAAFVWRARDLALNAATGQVGTLVRASAANASWDSYATNTISVVRERPRWASIYPQTSLDPAALVLGYVAGALTEYLSWPCGILPQAMSGLLVFLEQETITIGDASANGAGLFCISNPAVTTGPYLTLFGNNAGKYAITHDNDVSQVTATMATAPATSNRVTLRWALTSTGTVQLWQSLNGAAETTPGASGTLALGALWGTAGSAAQIWLNTQGTAGLAYGYVEMQGVVIMPGIQSQAVLLQALAY